MARLHWSTAGESHGEALVALLDGLPAGIALTTDDLRDALARRRLGHGRGSRQKFEQDRLRVLGGLRHGRTIGSPLAVEIANSEWPKWETVMSADPVPREALLIDAGTGDEREVARNRPLTRPRPGHADLTGMAKYGFDDARPALERASARETASRVALGRVAEALLDQVLGATVVSHVLQIGSVRVPDDYALPGPDATPGLDASPVRSLDPAISEAMVAEIDAAQKDGDTLGGIVEVVVHGLPIGLGSYAQWDRRLDARLAGAMMSIQAAKAVEMGEGMRSATVRGSDAQDEMLVEDGELVRTSNRAGGTEGGVSNGQPLRVRVAFKPISTIPRALRTVDVATGQAAEALHQRSDTCAVPAAAVVAQAMAALVVADAACEKFGGDSVEEMRRNVEGYLAHLPEILQG
jgi:chorismate synthase